MQVAPDCVVQEVKLEKNLVDPREQDGYEEDGHVEQGQANHGQRETVFSHSTSTEHHNGEQVENEPDEDENGRAKDEYLLGDLVEVGDRKEREQRPRVLYKETGRRGRCCQSRRRCRLKHRDDGRQERSRLRHFEMIRCRSNCVFA